MMSRLLQPCCCALRALRGLVLALMSTWAAAGAGTTTATTEPDPAVLESIGMYVASLQRSLASSEVRGLSQPTEHQAGVFELQLRDAQLVRLHLVSRSRALPPESRQAKKLQQFLDDWTEERFAEGFSAARRDSLLDPAVRKLASTFPEAGQWKTLFPFFRP